MNFTRRKWRRRGNVNTLPDKSVTPRLAMQMAICTDGNLYCSLAQVNTDHEMFCLFISKLAATLTSENRNWRDNTLLLIDGARYQTSRESIRHLKALGFKVCVSAPYSFASAPIEYAFAFLKAVDLNPQGLKTGKR